jgi:hypothetical protein
MDSNELVRMDACPEAVEWAEKFGSDWFAAWASCPRADWLMWFASRVGVDLQSLVLAACACAETALVYVITREDRPRQAIEVARAWCRGEATITEVREAAMAARLGYDDLAAFACYSAAVSAVFDKPVESLYDAVSFAATAVADAYGDSFTDAWEAARLEALHRMVPLIHREIQVAVLEYAILAY